MQATLHHFGPYQIPTHVTHCLCADGKRRYARITSEPDTYYTIPANVKISSITVTGYVTSFCINGKRDYQFIAVKWGKNYNLLQNDGEKGPKKYVFEIMDQNAEGGKRFFEVLAMTLEDAEKSLHSTPFGYKLYNIENLF